MTHLSVHRSAVLPLFQLAAGTLSSLMLTDATLRPAEWMVGVSVLIAACLSAQQRQEVLPSIEEVFPGRKGDQ